MPGPTPPNARHAPSYSSNRSRVKAVSGSRPRAISPPSQSSVGSMEHS